MSATRMIENAVSMTTSIILTWCQMPATIPAEKAEYTTMAMDPRSTVLVHCALAVSLTHRRANCPIINGKRSCMAISAKTELSIFIPLPEDMRSMTNAGVATTPTRFDAEALTMAPATFPRATEVNATEDCTVDGTRVRYKMPRYMSDERNAVVGRRAMPISGNTTKVNARIIRCSRQCLSPVSASFVERRAP